MSGADEHRAIVEGLAAFAMSLAEMGASDEDARAQLRSWVSTLGVTASIVREAVSAVARLPQPLEESAAEIERARPIREMLGVQSAEEQLAAALRGREWLERLAADLANGSLG